MTDSKTHDVHKKEVSTNWDSIQFNIPRTIEDFNNPDTSKHDFAAFQDKSAFQRVIDTFSNRESDVYVATYPKCGTTWTIAIVNNLQKTVPEYGLSLGITCHSCPWVTEHAFLDTWEKSLEYFESEMKHPRVFKEHSPVGLLKGKKPRVIQCTRNPLDVFVSAWHHSIGKDFVYYYNGDFAHFIKSVAIKGLFEGGDWFDFHEEYLQAEKSGKIDILLLKYEEMKKDGGVQATNSIAKFLEISKDSFNVEEVVEKSSFKTLKKIADSEGFMRPDGSCTKIFNDENVGDVNHASRAHIRKGAVGDWVDYFDEDLIKVWREYARGKMESCPLVVDFYGEKALLGLD